MKYQYFVADVFTRQIFNGAQIAVFPNSEGLNELQMQLIARELNLTETVFIVQPRKANGSNRRRMRIFSPQNEIDFAGHPVIASAFVLASCGDLSLNDPITPLIFEQNTGEVEVNISSQQGKPSFVQFSRKISAIIDRFAPTDEELASFLGLEINDLDHHKYSTRLVACGLPYLIVPVWRYESVRKARFNFEAWHQSCAPQTAAQEILLFAPKTPYPDSDFNARLLGPRIAVHDDPPVGNAMPAFASYLCSFDFMQKGTYTFAVDRGDQLSRRSLLNLEMDHLGERGLTIRVGGTAVMVIEALMEIPEL